MSGAFTHTDQTDAIIRAGYAANRPVREIAAELGVTKGAVIGRARRLGLSDSQIRERWNERAARFAALYAEGQSCVQIARLERVPTMVVYSALARRGCQFRSKSEAQRLRYARERLI